VTYKTSWFDGTCDVTKTRRRSEDAGQIKSARVGCGVGGRRGGERGGEARVDRDQ
jgi:hypothetical protein